MDHIYVNFRSAMFPTFNALFAEQVTLPTLNQVVKSDLIVETAFAFKEGVVLVGNGLEWL